MTDIAFFQLKYYGNRKSLQFVWGLHSYSTSEGETFAGGGGAGGGLILISL
jgi:hypothetical protein